MFFRQLFDAESSTFSYLLADARTREAVLIDPVLDQVARDATLIGELGVKLVAVVDTHVHADHVTAAATLRARFGCPTVLGERTGAPCADRLVKEGDTLPFGRHELRAMETPGHTDGCLSWVTADGAMVFTGDALLVRGCGRTDFQHGDARTLYRSVTQKIFPLPDETTVYPAHDYQGRTASTVGEERRHNPRLGGGKTENDFVAIMAGLGLPYPKKMDLAVPANLACGVVPSSGAPVEIDRSWAPVVLTAAGVPEVTPAWLAANRGAAHVVDVREPDEYRGELGHVEDAELAPLATVASRAAGWDRARPIVTICRSGGRSGKAALELARLGFAQVASMAGGMRRWHAESLPVRFDTPAGHGHGRQG
jgi:glyoxylase-like metal-dependent hydrolase (beta-lactamase superfamily II)/rhodanese-related sulfurtransferase